MSEYKDFSSLPPDKEQSFVIYEKTSVEAGKKARVISLIVAASVLVVIMAVVFSFDPPKNLMADDDMGSLAAPTKEAKKPAAEAPKPEVEAAPAVEGEGAAPAAGEDEAPAEGAKPEGE